MRDPPINVHVYAALDRLPKDCIGAQSSLMPGPHLAAAFLDALMADFEQNGIEAIERLRELDRMTYLCVCAVLVPDAVRRAAQAERGSLS